MSEQDPKDQARSLVPTETTFRELLDIERLRVERDNRQLRVQEKGQELDDGQDLRRYKYASAQLEANVGLQRERMTFIHRFSWALAGFFAIVVFGLAGFAFYGNDEQRALAENVVILVVTAIAGFGFGTVRTQAAKTLASIRNIR